MNVTCASCGDEQNPDGGWPPNPTDAEGRPLCRVCLTPLEYDYEEGTE